MRINLTFTSKNYSILKQPFLSKLTNLPTIEFLGKLGYKLGALVRDYLSRESMKFSDMVQE